MDPEYVRRQQQRFYQHQQQQQPHLSPDDEDSMDVDALDEIEIDEEHDEFVGGRSNARGAEDDAPASVRADDDHPVDNSTFFTASPTSASPGARSTRGRDDRGPSRARKASPDSPTALNDAEMARKLALEEEDRQYAQMLAQGSPYSSLTSSSRRNMGGRRVIPLYDDEWEDGIPQSAGTPPPKPQTAAQIIDLVSPEPRVDASLQNRSSWSPLSILSRLTNRHERKDEPHQPNQGAAASPVAPKRQPSTGSDTADFVMVDDDDPFAPVLDSDRLALSSETTQDDEALARALEQEINRAPAHKPTLARSKSGGRRRGAGGARTEDEELARKLQEEEYSALAHPHYVSPRTRGRDLPAALIMDDMLELHGVDLSPPVSSRGRHSRRGFAFHRGGRFEFEDNRIPVGGQNLRLDSYEDLLRLDELNGVVKKGLSQQQIRALPQIPFQRGSKSEDECKCFVCFDSFENGEKVLLLPCLHAYHPKCVSEWLKDNRSCPVCRVEVGTGN